MKHGFKETELGWLPMEWEVKKLGDISKGKGIYGINASAVEFQEYLPRYLRITDIDNDGNFSTQKLASVDDKNSKEFYLKTGDLVFVRTGSTTGKSYLYNKKDGLLVFAGFLIKFSIDFKKANDYYIWNYTKTTKYSNWVQKLSQRSGQPGLNSNEYFNLLLPLPPLPEQKSIADCLSIWDNAIESQSQLIKAKEARKKALMQQLLTGKKRLPGFTEKWKKVKLGDLFSERNETKIIDLPLLSIGQDGVYPQTDSIKRDISNTDKSKYRRIFPGDIGYNTMRMWQGRSALSGLEGIVSPAYTILTPRENVNSYYFSILFKTSKLTNLFWRNSQGLVDDTLNCKYKDFSKIKYSVPSFEEQTVIATILKTAEKEIQIEKQKLADLQKQKKGLMQQLLTGKVRLV